MGRAALVLLAALAVGCAERAPAPGSAGQAAAAPSPQQVTVTHVGNAGFLIRAGDDAILVDALYRDGVEGYEVIPAAQRALLEAAQPPFDGVDRILVTHAHADHFDPEAVGLHMSANAAARLITTPQGEQRLSEGFLGFGALDNRVSGILPPEGTLLAAPGDGREDRIAVRVMQLPHGAAQNLGFLVDIGGMRFLHVGDTDAAAGDYARLGLAQQGIDVALVPYWLLAYETWRGSVPEAIGARRLLAMHLPLAGGPAEDAASTGGRAAMLADMAARFPGVIVLDEPMASVSLSGRP